MLELLALNWLFEMANSFAVEYSDNIYSYTPLYAPLLFSVCPTKSIVLLACILFYLGNTIRYRYGSFFLI